MEKIQVELNTDVSESKSKPCKYNFINFSDTCIYTFLKPKMVFLIYLVLYGL